MTFVRMVKVTIVQVVDVTTVTYCGVSTTWSMLMSMVGMGWGGATRHETASSRNLRCANAAVRIFCGDVKKKKLVNRGPCGKGDHLAHVGPRLPCPLREPLFPERGLVLS
jgi:hypothetical protein